MTHIRLVFRNVSEKQKKGCSETFPLRDHPHPLGLLVCRSMSHKEQSFKLAALHDLFYLYNFSNFIGL